MGVFFHVPKKEARRLSDSFGFKLGIEGERKFKNALKISIKASSVAL